MARGGLENGKQALRFGGRCGGGDGVNVARLWNRHPRFARQVPNGINIALTGMLHEKTDRRPMGSASKAVVKLLGGTHGKGRRFFAVKRAEPQKIGARALEFHVPPHHVDDIDAGKQLLNEVLRNHPASLARQPGLYLSGYRGHVGSPSQGRADLRHDLAHVLGTCGARGGNGRFNGCSDLTGIGLLGQIGEQHRELELFAVGKILASARFELSNGITPLLGKFFNDCGDLGIVERDALIDLTLLDGSKQQPHRGQAIGLTRPHRRFHVFADSVFETHDVPRL